MMHPLMISIIILWFVSAIFDYAYFTYYAQLKEYRYDRLKDFLSTKGGKELLFDFRMLWRTVLIVSTYSLLIGSFSIEIIAVTILLIDLMNKLYHIRHRNIRRPVPTPKALLVILIALGIEGTVFYFYGTPNIFLFLMIIRSVIVSIVVIGINVPSALIKKSIIYLAQKKLRIYTNMRVIGITGSYGKSSTKEFLSHILSGAFHVIKTPKNINTEIGIALFILKTNFTDADMFVVEMGAYRVGEIKAICDMVHPTIGILTAISQQHLSLFGSIENICKAKHELLYALPKHGIAITNADNTYCRKHLDELDATVITFGTEAEFNPTALIQDIENTPNGIRATATAHGEERTIEAPVVGRHNAYNIVPAALLAHALGMTKDAIDKRIATLPNGHGSLKEHRYGNAIVLDDSANSNPDGFKAALDVLNTYPSNKKRIVITRGMGELGEQSNELHEQIGGEISFVADELVIITPDFVDAISAGVVGKYKTDIRKIFGHADLVRYIESQKDEEVVILLESRMPSAVRNAFDFLS